MLTCLALPELVFNSASVQKQLNYLFCAPVMVIGNDNIPAEHLFSAGNLVRILTETQVRSAVCIGKLKTTVPGGNVQLLSQLEVSLPYCLRITPVRLPLPVITSVLNQG